ncbi:helix-turn-helix transcriptional regulator [Planctomicrobium piriforme]|uniref:Helix-turn-helix n=1 Tax=Planctomicrobium piriforme TaxID=1576369 RepID=A0A1I3ENB9_9PLAN|nr:helix-turn-helix transcriptional regulator [Planctomicrobium piriforme]SFI00373.1 Helix-turn-helix [Planctomicrobium piriforme]
MKPAKQKKLEAAGWKVGSAADFLGLTDAEEMLVSMKLALAGKVKELRQGQNITQTELAKRIGSSQSRVAKLETADRSVSLELLMRTLVTLGASQNQIGRIVSQQPIRKRPAVSRKNHGKELAKS